MADSTREPRRASASLTGPAPPPQSAESISLTPIISNAQTSNASSTDSVPVFSDGSRSRSNTPTSLASSNPATSPESSFGFAKTDPSPSRLGVEPPQYSSAGEDLSHVGHVRTSSHGSARSRPSPRTFASNAEAINSGHHASQTLETIPQHELPPPVARVPTSVGEEAAHTSTAAPNDHLDRTHIRWTAAQSTDDEPSPSDPDALTRTNSWWSAPLFWSTVGSKKLSKLSAKEKFFGVASLTFAAVGTVYLYRGYKTQQWQALAELYNVCQNVKQDQGGHGRCQDLLKHPLPDPPYTNVNRELEEAHKRRQKRAFDLENMSDQSTSGASFRIFVSLLMLASVLSTYTALMWLTSQNWSQQGEHDGFRTGRRFWPVNQQPLDHFSPVNVRIAPLHHQTTVPPGQHEGAMDTKRRDHKPTLPAHLRQKRQFHILSVGIPSADAVRRKSLESDDSLTKRPSWKHGGLPRSDSMSLKDPDDASTIRSELTDEEQDKLEGEQPTQIGDALKGTTNNDLILQPTNSSKSSNTSHLGWLRKRLHKKTPGLPYYFPSSDDSSDDEPIMTALGADPYDSFNPEDSEDTHIISQRKNVVLSGFVAVAMAQAGSALASTAGGAIGRNILVQHVEEEAHEIHEMITTGKKRQPTDLALYEAEKKQFLDGPDVKRRVRRRESGTLD